MAILRRAFNIAVREGWLEVSPFHKGDPLISLAEENVRTRVLSEDEEKRLLSACTGRRAHLYPIIIFAVGTGFRRGEIFGTLRRDVDFQRMRIKTVSIKGKKFLQREAPISDRLYEALQSYLKGKLLVPEDKIFPVSDNIKQSFGTACEKAGLKELNFNDLRATFATRLIKRGIKIHVLAKLMGHRKIETTYRYLRMVEDDLDGVREIMGSAAA